MTPNQGLACMRSMLGRSTGRCNDLQIVRAICRQRSICRSRSAHWMAVGQQDQSAFAPEAFTTGAHLAISVLTKAPN